MFRIVKSFRFEAAHSLDHLPQTHKCSRLHGHSYQVDLVLEAEELDQNGFVVDFGDLSSSFGKYLNEQVDHHNLNDLPLDGAPTTAEVLAKFFFDVCSAYPWAHLLRAVCVHETAGAYAEYSPV